ncbi:CD83 antigen [Microcaecilia unicolor]|uniref:CD83 antigen n=1 Tax=Microcaecilia unicolor TaxID=1415580 RepID=A0A6P7WRY8_9AMPH|nr:CD83 antigen [Microcaecilia unicolor]
MEREREKWGWRDRTTVSRSPAFCFHFGCFTSSELNVSFRRQLFLEPVHPQQSGRHQGEAMLSKWYFKSLLLQNIWCVIHTTTVSVMCTEDAVLPCIAPRDPNTTYRAITWYKINGSSEQMSMLARRNLLNNTEPYSEDLEDSEEVFNKMYLKIKNSTISNSGIYKCCLWAPVGKLNTRGFLKLTVLGCPGQEEGEMPKNHMLEFFLISIFVVFGLFLMFLNYKCLQIQKIFSMDSKSRKTSDFLLLRTQEKEKIQHLGTTVLKKSCLV